MRKKFDVSYFKYTIKNGDKQIKHESGIDRRRLITLLEKGRTIDVFHVMDYDTGKVYLDDPTDQGILWSDLHFPSVDNVVYDDDDLS